MNTSHLGLPSSWRSFLLLLCATVHLPLAAAEPALPTSSDVAWPIPARDHRPWARWWWLGSAVDRTNLTRHLTLFQQAGFGGVEICPIYGAKGEEERFIPFLSPLWMEMLAHTTREAKQLGLGIDLTTGTGWPFGGPNVSPPDASARLVLKAYSLGAGQKLDQPLPPGSLQCLRAISPAGDQIDLTASVTNGVLSWTAPSGGYRVYAVVQISPVQKVKRAAPGGEGNVLDPYSVRALDHYLTRFTQAFEDYRGLEPRSHFHDSFEYYNAQWTPLLFTEFLQRRGYDLRSHLPALFGEGPSDTIARVKGDYRETVADLHLDYVKYWTDWCGRRGSLSRNQAHGAPANLIDLYAAAVIPETESFGATDEKLLPMLKFASSAAHLTGRTLASAEAFTWLNEHFQTPLAQAKQAADYLFLAGVNHLFYHGIPYSPEQAPWPGWQFYAAVNFGPHGGLWRDLPDFNAYVTRCQSLLQSGASGNDLLLYFPLHDLYQTPGELLVPLTVHNVEKILAPHPFYATALDLLTRGYAFDFISDRFLSQASAQHAQLRVNGRPYRALLVPRCRIIPEQTLHTLLSLAEQGAPILFHDAVPSDVPGFAHLEARRAQFQADLGRLQFNPASELGIQHAALGAGSVRVGSNLPALLNLAGVTREPCVDSGLRFVRRVHAEGHLYFFANRSANPVDAWITLGTPAQSAVLLDPLASHPAGVAPVRPSAAGSAQVYLQLSAGQSCFLRTFAERAAAGDPWPSFRAAGQPHPLSGEWHIEFIEGGPVLPPRFSSHELKSWTGRDSDAARFHGTARYTLQFEAPAVEAVAWRLDLGLLHETARVKLNGRELGLLWSPPFHLTLAQQLPPGTNQLEIEVTNLAANRIADLDRRKVPWKHFYDINMASKFYRSLDASHWPALPSGLLGPVQLIPLAPFYPAPQ